MPDILFVPSTANQDQIEDCIDRLKLGDMLIVRGRVLGLTAFSTMAISTGSCRSADRRWFPAIDALVNNQESPCSTPESAARFIVELGVVPGDAEPEWKSQRIARHYRQDRAIKRKRNK